MKRVCDVAVTYRVRPRSLHLRLQPARSPHGTSLHAKVTLMVFENAIRVVVGSANLTEPGYRKNREVVAVITATKKNTAEAEVVRGAIAGMELMLGDWLNPDANKVISRAKEIVAGWDAGQSDPDSRFQWSGKNATLWREFLAMWPSAEPVRKLTIVSPFWSEGAETAVGAFLRELKGRNLLHPDIEVFLLTEAFVDAKKQYRPVLPTSYAAFDWKGHHWKNGPEAGTNGFGDFARYIAPHVRRALLLTATPFQLRPEEMLEILKVSETMQPCPTNSASLERVALLKSFREQKLKPALQRSEHQSRIFSRAWSRLLPTIKTEELEAAWNQPFVENVRKGILLLAGIHGPRSSGEKGVQELIDGAIAGSDPDVRQFLREALMLFSTNADLSCELGKVIVRHRRHTEHRSFRVGAEYQLNGSPVPDRPDRHLLHAAPGLDIRGEAELPQFLLMRCVFFACCLSGATSKKAVGANCSLARFSRT